MKNLTSLILGGKNRKIDFSFLPLLTELIIDWSPKYSNLGSCTLLETLTIYKYNPKANDFSSLSDVAWTKKLGIVQSSINNLKELKDFDRLEKLEISYCSKLESICCLENCRKTLISLIFDHCVLVANHDYVTQLPNLEILAFNDCRTLPSIKFIKEMKSLKDFRFVKTNILDGDMTPCIGLRHAGFFKMKHYSHTPEQIKSINSKN